MLDRMSIERSCDFGVSPGCLIGYALLSHSQEPEVADDVPLATDALIFMVVGLAAPSKMQIGYFMNAVLCCEALKNLVLEVIAGVEECGLRVVAVVCDCLGANVGMATLVGCQVHEDS
ncbi:hypothetical protein HPB48_019233 [Haemaphysalis longicornis]|uniref:Transposable element P transposase-like RNase H domain-containing protein n=1 Tax=Haemaphysalis longicornis TaxID=44386 RepID=A0A9J6G9C0_HAELO|nr:hypothetical protein HPB48_019233 [Haemaphysalis longicornis]